MSAMTFKRIIREILLVLAILVVVYLPVTVSMNLLVRVVLALELLRILLNQVLSWWLLDCPSPFLLIIFINFAPPAIFLLSHSRLLESLLLIQLTCFLCISKSWVLFNILFSILVSLDQQRPVPYFGVNVYHFVFVLPYFFLLLPLELLYSV